jgi:tRNA nucleotidyltransferase (CCA-adding enzyme)
MLVIDYAAGIAASLPVRFAALTHDLGKATTPKHLLPAHHGHEVHSVALLEQLCERLRVPAECRELAVLAARYHGDVHRAAELRPGTVLKLLTSTDLFRRPERFEELLSACECDWRGRAGFEARPYPQAELLRAAATAARGVDAGAIAQQSPSPEEIPRRIEAARLEAVSAALAREKGSIG